MPRASATLRTGEGDFVCPLPDGRSGWVTTPTTGSDPAKRPSKVAAAIWGVMYLYRREGRSLGFPIRVMLSTLRMIALLGVVIMLLEPVVVFTKTEHVPSTILILRDHSESMDLKDAYASADPTK